MSKQVIPPPIVQQPRVVAQLTIALMESGNVAVRGSIDDLILAYGMLEMAKDAIRANAQQQTASPLLLPPALRMRQRPQPLPPQETQSDVKEKGAGQEGDSQQGAGRASAGVEHRGSHSRLSQHKASPAAADCAQIMRTARQTVRPG